jgi:hypothetical protein
MIKPNDGIQGREKIPAYLQSGGVYLGRVVRVYPMDYSVDAFLLKTGELPALSFLPKKPKDAPLLRIPVMTPMAGAVPTENWFSEQTEYGKTIHSPLTGYGEVKLPKEGDYVLIVFLESDYSCPVVIGCLHPASRFLNVTGSVPSGQQQSNNSVAPEEDRYITVYPSMLWKKVNKNGEVEISFPFGKSLSEKEGFYFKVGKLDASHEAVNMHKSALDLKEKLEMLQDALPLKDLPVVQQALADIQAGTKTVAEVADELRKDKDVQVILTGDPHKETDYIGPGCCCGAEDSSSCTCGALWGTCPSCVTANSCSPCQSSTLCSNCETLVPCS